MKKSFWRVKSIWDRSRTISFNAVKQSLHKGILLLTFSKKEKVYMKSLMRIYKLVKHFLSTCPCLFPPPQNNINTAKVLDGKRD